MNNNRRERFVLRYTLMFAFVAVAVLSVFVLNGRSLIRGLDGPAQHYAALRYLGEWLRTGLSGGGWKMIDFSLGQGMDVLTTLSYYCFTEPLAMISVLVPVEYTEYLYAALLFARFYLAGLFAAMLARCHGAKGWTAAVCGVLYGCGSFMAAGGLWHFNFGVGLVLLPLMLLAVEHVFRTGRWRAYVAVVALQLMSSFYFAYMNTVIVQSHCIAVSGIDRNVAHANADDIGIQIAGSDAGGVNSAVVGRNVPLDLDAGDLFDLLPGFQIVAHGYGSIPAFLSHELDGIIHAIADGQGVFCKANAGEQQAQSQQQRNHGLLHFVIPPIDSGR